MLLLTIYEKIQMNLKVKFKGNRACASSIICRMTHPITDIGRPKPTKKIPIRNDLSNIHF